MSKKISTGFVALSLLATSNVSLAAMGDDPILVMLKADQFEVRDADEGTVSTWEGHLWIGKDVNKLWIKSEGERLESESESIETQLLYSRAIDSNWDLQLGFRHDSIPSPDRDWAVIGFNGVAPYWFEVDTALFIGEDDRTSLRFETEYEFMLTQRWVLAPEIEINWFGEDDEELGIASGFTDVEAGIRLRYEITRELAPYIGINYEKLLGDTADIAEDTDEETSDTQLVLGLRFWF
jgi:copper resistance protein B